MSLTSQLLLSRGKAEQQAHCRWFPPATELFVVPEETDMTAKTTSHATGENIVKRWTAMLARKDALIEELVDALTSQDAPFICKDHDLIQRARAEVESCSGYRDFSPDRSEQLP